MSDDRLNESLDGNPIISFNGQSVGKQQQQESSNNQHNNNNNNQSDHNGLDCPIGDDVCRDYLRNVCRRGPNCRYRHPDDTEAADLGKNIFEVVFCHDYQNRECRRNNCRFIHATKDEEQIYRSGGELAPHLMEKIKAKIQSLPPESAYLNQLMITPDTIPICKDFLKGDCRRGGNRCKFRHLSQTEADMELRGMTSPGSMAHGDGNNGHSAGRYPTQERQQGHPSHRPHGAPHPGPHVPTYHHGPYGAGPHPHHPSHGPHPHEISPGPRGHHPPPPHDPYGRPPPPGRQLYDPHAPVHPPHPHPTAPHGGPGPYGTHPLHHGPPGAVVGPYGHPSHGPVGPPYALPSHHPVSNGNHPSHPPPPPPPHNPYGGHPASHHNANRDAGNHAYGGGGGAGPHAPVYPGPPVSNSGGAHSRQPNPDDPYGDQNSIYGGPPVSKRARGVQFGDQQQQQDAEDIKPAVGPSAAGWEAQNNRGYQSLEDENSALRRRIDDLKKQVADLMATNDFLLDQNAQLRALSKAGQAAAAVQTAVAQAQASQAAAVASEDVTTVTVPTGTVHPVVAVATGAGFQPVGVTATVELPVVSIGSLSAATGLPVSSIAASLSSVMSTSSSAPLISYPIMATATGLHQAIAFTQSNSG